ncbi:hypothetical protein BO82DRAFT_364884 [Aspergillus uvarum CBS 121591]|uniref:Uncharacterized protein n=1 Tax=Aspergillus uvarum CBS 121591 TaxID=1448315 RepID=A0A319DR76_9EURO|nr:hypothetical protein BO82DRAFT_364884 [Aspergillus uvarum CBS 121591]PYH81712.1 hypothetical protein BO82DRAFT_364884 [Aspergillus uvarum CBS 121591]
MILPFWFVLLVMAIRTVHLSLPTIVFMGSESQDTRLPYAISFLGGVPWIPLSDLMPKSPRTMYCTMETEPLVLPPLRVWEFSGEQALSKHKRMHGIILNHESGELRLWMSRDLEGEKFSEKGRAREKKNATATLPHHLAGPSLASGVTRRYCTRKSCPVEPPQTLRPPHTILSVFPSRFLFHQMLGALGFNLREALSLTALSSRIPERNPYVVTMVFKKGRQSMKPEDLRSGPLPPRLNLLSYDERQFALWVLFFGIPETIPR